MTIKEIANFTGRKYNTITLWCSKTAQGCSKIEQAKKTNIAADFTLEETIKILEAGKMSKDFIDLLAENIRNKESKKLTVLSNNLTVTNSKDQPLSNGEVNNYVTKDDLKEFAKSIIQETIKSIIPLINNQKQLPEPVKQVYKEVEIPLNRQTLRMTVFQYCNNNKVPYQRGFIPRLQRLCNNLSLNQRRKVETDGSVYNNLIFDYDIIESGYNLIMNSDRKLFS